MRIRRVAFVLLLVVGLATSAAEGPAVFVGDSLTARGDWATLLGDPTIVNQGVGSDTTARVLARLNDAITEAPSRVFLLVGVNDLARGSHPDEIRDRYAEILIGVRQAAPDAQLYVQSVLYVNPAIYGTRVNNQDIAIVNELLAALAAEVGATFIDLNEALAPNGELEAQFTTDGIHLSAEGYSAWAQALRPHLP